MRISNDYNLISIASRFRLPSPFAHGTFIRIENYDLGNILSGREINGTEPGMQIPLNSPAEEYLTIPGTSVVVDLLLNRALKSNSNDNFPQRSISEITP